VVVVEVVDVLVVDGDVLVVEGELVVDGDVLVVEGELVVSTARARSIVAALITNVDTTGTAKPAVANRFRVARFAGSIASVLLVFSVTFVPLLECYCRKRSHVSGPASMHTGGAMEHISRLLSFCNTLPQVRLGLREIPDRQHPGPSRSSETEEPGHRPGPVLRRQEGLPAETLDRLADGERCQRRSTAMGRLQEDEGVHWAGRDAPRPARKARLKGVDWAAADGIPEGGGA
jgi:hypothetical protein